MAKPITCKTCGKRGLRWHTVYIDPVLMENGKPHACPPKVMASWVAAQRTR